MVQLANITHFKYDVLNVCPLFGGGGGLVPDLV